MSAQILRSSNDSNFRVSFSIKPDRLRLTFTSLEVVEDYLLLGVVALWIGVTGGQFMSTVDIGICYPQERATAGSESNLHLNSSAFANNCADRETTQAWTAHEIPGGIFTPIEVKGFITYRPLQILTSWISFRRGYRRGGAEDT
ncbi:hypothetical protein DFH06DRAFT_1126690 [Mycena polygramma]|nr:hypothetical protein DFH06DRAFT_1126690 [Mycena polygramma]